MPSGKLTPSCGAMYFPSPPDDMCFAENVITITFQGELSPADRVLVFKVKSSAPTKFHVLPRYGALVIPANSESASLDVVVQLKDTAGSPGSNESPAHSIAQRTNPPNTNNGNSNNNRQHDYQEKFSIESFLVSRAESVAVGMRSSSGKEVQDLYDQASQWSGKGLDTSIPLKAVSIKAYTENVWWNESGPPPPQSIVPIEGSRISFKPYAARPRSARNAGTPLKMLFKKNSDASAATPRGESLIPPPIPLAQPPSTSASESEASKLMEESQRLREQLQQLQNAIDETALDKKQLEKSLAQGSSALQRRDEQQSIKSVVDAPQGEKVSLTNTAKRKRGIPFMVVLSLMIVTFCVAFVMRSDFRSRASAILDRIGPLLPFHVPLLGTDDRGL